MTNETTQPAQVLTDAGIDSIAFGMCLDDKPAAMRRFARAIEAAIIAKQAANWQPMETVPKDGTVILVREERCSGMAVMYLYGWKYESGGICYLLDPTHWMPLPTPPATKPPEAL